VLEHVRLANTPKHSDDKAKKFAPFQMAASGSFPLSLINAVGAGTNSGLGIVIDIAVYFLDPYDMDCCTSSMRTVYTKLGVTGRIIPVTRVISVPPLLDEEKLVIIPKYVGIDFSKPVSELPLTADQRTIDADIAGRDTTQESISDDDITISDVVLDNYVAPKLAAASIPLQPPRATRSARLSANTKPGMVRKQIASNSVKSGNYMMDTANSRSKLGTNLIHLRDYRGRENISSSNKKPVRVSSRKGTSVAAVATATAAKKVSDAGIQERHKPQEKIYADNISRSSALPRASYRTTISNPLGNESLIADGVDHCCGVAGDHHLMESRSVPRPEKVKRRVDREEPGCYLFMNVGRGPAGLLQVEPTTSANSAGGSLQAFQKVAVGDAVHCFIKTVDSGIDNGIHMRSDNTSPRQAKIQNINEILDRVTEDAFGLYINALSMGESRIDVEDPAHGLRIVGTEEESKTILQNPKTSLAPTKSSRIKDLTAPKLS
jgi:hypothetical protein